MKSFETHVLNRPITSMGRFMYRWIPYRKKVVEANISLAYGEKLSSAAQAHLVKAFYSHFVKIILENLKLRFLSDKKLKEQVIVEGVEHLLEVAKSGKGVLILTGHLGNWEFAPLGGISQFKEYHGQLYFIRRTIDFLKPLEKILFKRYYKAGLRVIPKTYALNKIMSVLEQNNAVVFVLDQHASPVNKDGIIVDFFGKPAGTYRSLAMIANYTGVPVVPAANFRTADNKHVLKFYPPLPWLNEETSHKEMLANTRQYNQVLENIINEHPEQWWWLHKRWKLKPEQIKPY